MKSGESEPCLTGPPPPARQASTELGWPLNAALAGAVREKEPATGLTVATQQPLRPLSCAAGGQRWASRVPRQERRLLLACWRDQLGDGLCESKEARSLHLHPALLRLDPGADGPAPSSNHYCKATASLHLHPRSEAKAKAKANRIEPVSTLPVSSPEAAGLLYSAAGAPAVPKGEIAWSSTVSSMQGRLQRTTTVSCWGNPC